MTFRDAQPVGHLLTRAFNEVFRHHGYPPPFATEQDGIEIAQWYFHHEPEGSFVADIRGQVVGAAYLHRRGRSASVGPVAVDPKFQHLGLGRRLMEHLLQAAADCPSVRLFQDAFNTDSFALYTKLGFAAVDIVPIVVLPGNGGAAASASSSRSRSVPTRRVGVESLEIVKQLDKRLTGLERPQDLRYLLDSGAAYVWRQGASDAGFICAYSSRGGVYVGPGAAEDAEQLYQLIHAVRGHYRDSSMIFRLPARPLELLQRLLNEGCRLANLGTFMVRGEWTPRNYAELLAVFPESL